MILAGDFIPQRMTVLLPENFKGELVLANLEGAICEDGLPVSNKVGICLHTTKSDEFLNLMKGFAFSLANNHLMDFREEGLYQTVRALTSFRIPFAGAGMCEEDARKPMILVEGDKRIAVYCCCERQFGMATTKTSGCAELGVWLYEAIRNIKKNNEADFVVVSCHSASEYSPWVSPKLHDFYHSLIDSGADCIHGHHAHVPQGYEVYNGRPIFYGLGNFVVDPSMWKCNKNQLWSVVVKIKFEEQIKWEIKTYCVAFRNGKIQVVKSTEDEMRWHHFYLSMANRQFESREMLLGCWQEVCVFLYRRLYEQQLRAPSVVKHRLSIKDVLRKLIYLGGDVLRIMARSECPSKLSIRNGKVLYNYYNCQSHSDVIATAIGVLTGAENDFRSVETRGMADMFFGDKKI